MVDEDMYKLGELVKEITKDGKTYQVITRNGKEFIKYMGESEVKAEPTITPEKIETAEEFMEKVRAHEEYLKTTELYKKIQREKEEREHIQEKEDAVREELEEFVDSMRWPELPKSIKEHRNVSADKQELELGCGCCPTTYSIEDMKYYIQILENEWPIINAEYKRLREKHGLQ